MKAYLDNSVVFLFVMLMGPVVAYLMAGLRARRNEIMAGMDANSIRLYFRQFQPGTLQDRMRNVVVVEGKRAEATAFETYYKSQFGGKHFMLPTLLLALVSGILLEWSALSVEDWLGVVDGKPGPIKSGRLPELAVAAFMGGYMYVVYEMVSRWNVLSLSPSDILWFAFRLGISVPLGYALTAALQPNLGPPTAFMLGAFPLSALVTFAKRMAAKTLDGSTLPETGKNQLLELDGVDVRIAERLAAEEITTPLQLAYADPVKLAICTNLGFTFLSDCASQALLYIYVLDRFQDFRKTSLRSSFEVRGLVLAMEAEIPEDPVEAARISQAKQEAEQKFKAIADALKINPDILRNFVQEIGYDPYAEFHHSVFYLEREG